MVKVFIFNVMFHRKWVMCARACQSTVFSHAENTNQRRSQAFLTIGSLNGSGYFLYVVTRSCNQRIFEAVNSLTLRNNNVLHTKGRTEIADVLQNYSQLMIVGSAHDCISMFAVDE